MNLTSFNRLSGLRGPIMITGHTGFKGSWLTFLLEYLDVPVVGLSLPPERDSLFDRAKRTDAIPERFLDVRNRSDVFKFVSHYEPAAIIHLAAQPLVLESYLKPIATFEINVLGTANILDAAFNVRSVEAVVVVTTDKVYRNNNSSQVFVETDPLEGKDPYSASKVGGESVVAAWQQIAKMQGGPKVISVRAGNVIGGGDWAANRLMPDLIRGFLAGEPTHIRNPRSTRPWQHVLDPLHGYLMGLEAILNGLDFSSMNFGPEGDSLSVREVAEIAGATWPRGIEFRFDIESEINSQETINLQLNSSCARNLLRWTPKWNQRQAVEASVEWWKKYLIHGDKPRQACDSDIESLFM